MRIRMKLRRREETWPLAAALSIVLQGCVTVHLYFPEAEIRDAAEEIVNDARPEVVDRGEPPAEPAPSSSSSEGSGSEEATREPGRTEGGARADTPRPRPGTHLASFAPEEAEKVQIDISSPVIKRIRESLKKRYPKVLPWYERGVFGEARDGYLALRNVEGLSLKEKKDVQTLLSEENTDRKNLYTEIARENKIDAERIGDIGILFSDEWQKKSKTGWWIEAEKGKWIRKPADKKGKGKAEKAA